MVRQQRKRIGEVLSEMGLVTPEQLTQALERQQRTGERLGRALVAVGVSEDQIAHGLSHQLELPMMDFRHQDIDPAAVALLPESLARKYSVLPIRREGTRLMLAMSDPLDVVALDDVAIATGMIVAPVVTTETEIASAIEISYGMGDRAKGLLEEIAARPGAISEAEEDEDVGSALERTDAPVIRLADLIVSRGMRDRASDIHIEPMETSVRVRYRIDGILQTVMTIPRNASVPLIARFKVLARMNVAERRAPQDGSFQMAGNGKTVDVRMSSIPTVHGERVVLRLLDKADTILSLEQIGMGPDLRERFERLIRLPWGIILVSGPTGSGKTTTLVSSIAQLNTLDDNIITVEDPVEYQIPGVNQMAVNPRAGLTFATALRAIVRQDPDIIMVGEIRDVETAEIAIHASLTGHLVFSTIHTNDAPSVATRLLDMGIEPFLITSSLVSSIAQRLVRVLCPHCKRPAAASTVEAAETEIRAALGPDVTVKIHEPVGCVYCRYTGYAGRTGIFEMLVVNNPIRQLILRRASATEILETAQQAGMRTMRDDGLLKVASGVTTMEEVLRVTRVVDVE